MIPALCSRIERTKLARGCRTLAAGHGSAQHLCKLYIYACHLVVRPRSDCANPLLSQDLSIWALELPVYKIMPNAYNEDFRQRAVRVYVSGRASYARLAAGLGVHRRTLERWVAIWRTTGRAEPLPKRGGRRSPIDASTLQAVIRELGETRLARVTATYNGRVTLAHRSSRSSIRRAIWRCGFRGAMTPRWPRRKPRTSPIAQMDVARSRHSRT
jgi:transposase-like protein